MSVSKPSNIKFIRLIVTKLQQRKPVCGNTYMMYEGSEVSNVILRYLCHSSAFIITGELPTLRMSHPEPPNREKLKYVRY